MSYVEEVNDVATDLLGVLDKHGVKAGPAMAALSAAAIACCISVERLHDREIAIHMANIIINRMTDYIEKE